MTFCGTMNGSHMMVHHQPHTNHIYVLSTTHLGAPSEASCDSRADLDRPSAPQLSSECCAWLALAEASPAWLLRRRPGTSAPPGAFGDSAATAAEVSLPPAAVLPPPR